MHKEMLDQWTQRQRRKERQSADDDHGPYQETYKERAMRREGAT